MEKQGKEKTKVETDAEAALKELHEAIRNAPQAIEQEFAATANTWPACFGSMVYAIETYLNSKIIKGSLPPEVHAATATRLKTLKEKLQKLKPDYPNKETLPPEKIRQKFLEELANILEE